MVLDKMVNRLRFKDCLWPSLSSNFLKWNFFLNSFKIMMIPFAHSKLASLCLRLQFLQNLDSLGKGLSHLEQVKIIDVVVLVWDRETIKG